ncbi:MAG: lysylphosphatidylglycerol synthase transmembrane domain-containing protein [Lachnospiraceae bacterium]|nr:lysylphosphatidylglycerol synthase transmembrane domain-containing protein [Lachnospiraceae bacterium]
MKKRKFLWAILSYLIAVASIWMVIRQSKNFDIKELLANIRSMQKGWLLLSFFCMFGFIWFEGFAIVKIAEKLGEKPKVRFGTLYGAADVYFSAITPSASGGQPASAYFMLKDGIKSAVVTIVLLLNLVIYNLALLSLGAICFFVSGKMLGQVSIEFQILEVIGTLVLIGLSIVFVLAIYKEQILYRIGDGLISVLTHLKLMKNGEKRRKHLHHTIEEYKECAAVLSGNKRLLLTAFLLNLMQRLSQLAVTFTVFMSCGKGPVLSAKAMMMQTFVAVGSNSVPIPGAMGVADYMMLDGFKRLIGSADAVRMELLCRGITFYGCVLTGGILTAAGYIRRKNKNVSRKQS